MAPDILISFPGMINSPFSRFMLDRMMVLGYDVIEEIQ